EIVKAIERLQLSKLCLASADMGRAKWVELCKRIAVDVYLPGRGFVPPKDFVSHFGHLRIPKVVYEGPFSRSFIEDGKEGKYPVVEGVVAKGVHVRRQRKGQSSQEVWMAKVKTRAWLAELARRAGESEDLRKELEQNEREQRLPAEATPEQREE